MDRVHAEDRKPILEALRRSLETRSEYDVENRLAMPDGGTRWISTRGHPTFDAENRAVRVMGVSMNITAAKLSELQLLQQRDELAHKPAYHYRPAGDYLGARAEPTNRRNSH